MLFSFNDSIFKFWSFFLGFVLVLGILQLLNFCFTASFILVVFSLYQVNNIVQVSVIIKSVEYNDDI